MLNDGLHSGNTNLKQTVSYLEQKFGKDRPELLIVLGSGLSNVLSGEEVLHSIPYTSIPGVPVSTVSGHAGVLEIIKHGTKKIAVMRGRFHIYEHSNSPDDVVRLVRALAMLGIKTALLTNAAGSTSLKNKPGDLILVKDHINMTGLTPLSSTEASSLGEIFIDMSEPYSIKLRKKIIEISKKEKMKIKEGVYAYMKGPQYETAAEIKMLNKYGADVVGMSTVQEVVALKQLNVEIACISTVTNYGTGVKKGKTLSHKEVKEIGKKTSLILDNLLKRFI